MGGYHVIETGNHHDERYWAESDDTETVTCNTCQRPTNRDDSCACVRRFN